jgi:deoxyxylulose-5-phosphate synthase
VLEVPVFGPAAAGTRDVVETARIAEIANADRSAIVTVEEAQAAGGLGGAVAELLAEQRPTPVRRIGIQDRFGTSGDPDELIDHYQLSAEAIKQAVTEATKTRRRTRSRRPTGSRGARRPRARAR